MDVEVGYFGWRKAGVQARLMTRFGLYPREALGDADHGYRFHPEATISLVRFEEHPKQYEGYSEVEWAYPEEIAFMASMALAMDEDEPRIIFYPESRGLQVNVDPSIPLNDPHLLDVVREKAILHRKAELRKSRQRMRDWREYEDHTASPPFLSKRKYSTRALDPVLHQALLPAIDPSDFLLVRGLSTWLRSAMLTQHMTFTEEAINTLFISMEASFRLVLRTLVVEGIHNPTSKDAASFLGRVFNEAPLDRYFEEYYDSRIKTMHPESRFGIFPHAPLMADDYYHLRDSLRHLYVYLLIGFVGVDLH